MTRERSLTGPSKAIYRGIVLATVLGAGFYYARWFHYSNRPLFYNTYKPARESIIWDWDLWPPPLSDYHGNLVFADFTDNMVAIVQFSDGSDGGAYFSDSDMNRFRIMLGKRFVDIIKKPDTLVKVAESGVQVVRKLEPGEGKHIYDELDRDSDRTVNNWQNTVHIRILQLLKGNSSSQPSTR
jgi:hypothetical protein